MEQERILVVDDDEGLLHLLRMRLSALRFSVTPCTNGQDALVAAAGTFDIAVTDLRLSRRWAGIDRRAAPHSTGLAGHYSYGPWQHPECRGGDAARSLWVFDQTV